MEYLGKKQDEHSEYLAEMGAGDGNWQTSLMERGEEESCYSSFLGKQVTKRIGKQENASLLVTVLRHMSPSFQPTAHGAGSSKSQSTVSSILRNLITCRTVDTRDSVIKNASGTDVCLKICKVAKLGSSARTSGDPWNQHQTASFDEVRDRKQSTDRGGFTDLKSVPEAYRPVRFPTCSLCGKEFKPENLDSHMKSCRGMKMLTQTAARASGTSEKASPWRSATYSDRISDQTSLLCH